MIPRGIRNCNPLNIRKGKDQWKGLLKVQNDKSFYQFKAMALVENGIGCGNLIRREEIKKGYKLAFG